MGVALKGVLVLFSFLFLVMFSLNLLAKTVVVTIPPLASAIKPLLSEDDKVVVLLGKNQSAHNFSLKPSHLFAIAKADLVISVGLGLDSWATKSIKRSGVSHIEFSELDDIYLLETKQNADGYEHHDHDNHDHHGANYDPHLWLDIDNIKLLVSRVAVELSVMDKLPAWLESLDKANKNINLRLEAVKSKPFLVQHAGFQYFDRKYNLNNIGSIQSNDASVGLKTILALRKRITKRNVSCVFASPHGSTKQVKSLVRGLKQRVNIVTLSAIGDANLDTVKQMSDLTDAYLNCLK